MVIASGMGIQTSISLGIHLKIKEKVKHNRDGQNTVTGAELLRFIPATPIGESYLRYDCYIPSEKEKKTRTYMYFLSVNYK